MRNFTYEEPAPGASYLASIPPEKRRDPNGECCKLFAATFDDEEVQEYRPNLYAKPALNIVSGILMMVFITATEKTFLDLTLGYMYHHILEESYKERRSRMVQVININLNDTVELQGYATWNTDLLCPICNTTHVRKRSRRECLQNYGPYIIENLTETTLKYWKYKAMIIGSNALLNLPKSAAKEYLNLGMLPHEQKTCHLLVGTMDMMNKRIQFITPSSTTPIIVEFPAQELYPSIQGLSQFIHSLSHCQRNYAGPIILVIPPYMPKRGGEPIQDYVEGKRNHLQIYKRGVMLGHTFGLAVVMLEVQGLERQPDVALTDLDWDDEALFNNRGQKTREMNYRIMLYLDNLVKILGEWETSPFTREAHVGYRSLRPEDVEARD